MTASHSRIPQQIDPRALGALAHTDELLRAPVETAPGDALHHALDPELGSLGWQLAHAVGRETYRLRSVYPPD
jgi:hypothetical protein